MTAIMKSSLLDDDLVKALPPLKSIIISSKATDDYHASDSLVPS
jgi:hypothetical protein